MRIFLGVIALMGAAYGFDSVVFSSKTPIGEEYPSLDVLVEGATPEQPVVFLVNPDFTLAQFSRQAGAYGDGQTTSKIVAAAKAATSKSSRFIDDPVYAPLSTYVSPSSPLEKGSAPVIIVEADNWSSLDSLAGDVLSELGDDIYAVVVTRTQAVSQEPVQASARRVKRISIDESGGGTTLAFPITMPPFNRSDFDTNPQALPCLFFLEGLNVIFRSDDKKTFYTAVMRENATTAGETVNKWNWKDSNIECKNGTFGISTVTIDLEKAVFKEERSSEMGPTNIQVNEQFAFKLELRADRGYWYLENATMIRDLVVTLANKTTVTIPSEARAVSVEYMGMNSVFSYGWNCENSQAMWFAGSGGSLIGISFHHVQYQIYHLAAKADGKDDVGSTRFTHRIDSCTGTFSPGSWMAIITSLVLFGVFIFGFLMLNSIQTMDRFDDPKQRQIVINVRE